MLLLFPNEGCRGPPNLAKFPADFLNRLHSALEDCLLGSQQLGWHLGGVCWNVKAQSTRYGHWALREDGC